MRPGVGKTWAMLEAAIQRQAAGAEVLACAVDTHGCPELEALLRKLPNAPRGDTSSHAELDLDAVLLWHPDVVLLDDLARFNAPGSRHAKRFQDALELLDAGIGVYGTLNVQNIESRKDAVAQITGVPAVETVPDSLLDAADELALIDVTPEQFLSRAPKPAAGVPDRLLETNLVALREMALRLVAEHADARLRVLRVAQDIGEPWKAGDRLMVAVSPSPSSEKLIRAARRLAASMEATWLAVYIDTPRVLSDLDQVRLGLNIALARQLGAEVIMIESTEIGPALLKLARQHNVSQIIMGKPVGASWRSLLRPSPVDWLVRNSGDIDIQLVRSGAGVSPLAASVRALGFRWRNYAWSIGIAGATTALALMIAEHSGPQALAFLYLVAHIVVATRLRRNPAMLHAALTAGLLAYLFLPPRLSPFIANAGDRALFAGYVAVAVLIAQIIPRLRAREHAERRSEARATTLYRFTRALAASHDLPSALNTAVQQIGEIFGARVALFLRNPGGAYTGEPHPAGTLAPGTDEDEAAAWVFRNRRAAGRFTDTLPGAGALHLPLLAGGEMEGVLTVRLPDEDALPPHRRELLEAFASQVALTVQKERLLHRIRAAQLAAQSERLQKTLLDSVSHELKTPLTAISAALEQESPELLRREVGMANARLRRIVGNLLDMTRLESGSLQLNREWCDVAELIQGAIDCAGEPMRGREIRRDIGAEMDPIHVDAGLFEQALANILANAAAYAHGPVEISAQRAGCDFLLRVADYGPGLKPGEEERIFEKFHRSPGSPAGGIGLGLSIVRRLIEAHGGSVAAANRKEGGAVFSIRLPVTAEFKLPADLPP